MDPAINAVYDDPLILVDDVPIFNYTFFIASLPFSIIEYVEVFNKRYIYGDFVFNGIVLIKTKTDNFAGLFMPYGSIFAVYQTITPEVTIQFPEYSKTENKQSSLPDFSELFASREPAIRFLYVVYSFSFVYACKIKLENSFILKAQLFLSYTRLRS